MGRPLSVVIISPGMPHDGYTLWRRSLGGSETAALRVAEALARRGHNVSFFSNNGHNGLTINGVTYLDLSQAQQYLLLQEHDVTVVSRAIEFYRIPSQSHVRVLWCHDLALKRFLPSLSGSMWAIDAIYTVSNWMAAQYREVYNVIPPEVIVATRNGVDLPSIEPLKGLKRDRHKLVYGSRPERGLEQCLVIMELLLRANSPLYLNVAWYDNTVEQMKGYYQQLWQRAMQLPNVRLLGPQRQAEWHAELATARAMLYPGCAGPFREVSCIAALEAMAVGTPVICCAKGALTETLVPACATFVGDEDTNVQSPEYLEQFARHVMDLATQDWLFNSMSTAAYQRGLTVGWDDVAAQWEADWYRRIAARIDDAWRQERRMIREGDLEALSHDERRESANV